MLDSAVQLSLFEERLNEYEKTAARLPERAVPFMTTSSMPLERLYTPSDFHEREYVEKLGFPGTWPFTRGVHATGHRGKLWTMRMFAGFGNAEETNARFKYLLANGTAGLSVAYDMPTLYGYDTDDPEAEGEFGTCGVAVSSLADMEVLFDGIPLDKVTTSMTINSPAAMIWAMYLVNAQNRGFPLEVLSGTTQNDILKEYIAQKEYIFPPRPSTKLVVDTFDYGARYVPRWNTVSTSAKQARRPCRSLPSPWPTASSTSSRPWTPGSTSTASRPGCRSFSISTTISSRRSPSSGPRDGSGRKSCRSVSAPEKSAPCGAGSIARRPA